MKTGDATDEKLIAVHIGAIVIDVVGRFTMLADGDRFILFSIERDNEPVVKDKEIPLPVI